MGTKGWQPLQLESANSRNGNAIWRGNGFWGDLCERSRALLHGAWQCEGCFKLTCFLEQSAFILLNNSETILQKDNVPICKSQSTQTFWKAKVSVLEWPPYSPDVNLIKLCGQRCINISISVCLKFMRHVKSSQRDLGGGLPAAATSGIVQFYENPNQPNFSKQRRTNILLRVLQYLLLFGISVQFYSFVPTVITLFV